MAELTGKSPLDAMAPRVIGAMTLAEIDLGHLTSIAPFHGKSKAAADILKTAHGLNWPAPNKANGKAGARAIWSGRDLVLLAGPAPDPRLSQVAATTDQTDAWCCVTLDGPGAEDVLARLVPVDLRAQHFKRGHTARTLVGHINGSVTRIGAEKILILVFRSMAQTLVHDVETAMRAVAARATLAG